MRVQRAHGETVQRRLLVADRAGSSRPGRGFSVNGDVTREQVLAEGVPGGFPSLYDSFAVLEVGFRAGPRKLTLTQ